MPSLAAPRLPTLRPRLRLLGVFCALFCWLSGLQGARAQSEDEVARIYARLRGGQAAAEALETSLADLGSRLGLAEEAFHNVSHREILTQSELANVTEITTNNRKALSDIGVGTGDLNVAMKNLGINVEASEAEAEDADAASGTAADMAAQVNNMGEFKGRAGGCLESPAATVNGGKVQMWGCLKAKETQQWVFNVLSHSIKHMHGICLAAPEPGTTGSEVLMWACNSSLTSQQWDYNKTSGLVRNAGGLCLSAQSQSTEGSPMSLQTCDSAASGQLWNVIVGGAGLRMKLDALNKKLWDLQDTESSGSLDSMENEVAELEKKTDDLEALLGNKSRQVLVKRLRRGGDLLRNAVRHLGEAATFVEAEDETNPCFGGRGAQSQAASRPPTPSLGSDLGLDV